jgi:hypothetical protein
MLTNRSSLLGVEGELRRLVASQDALERQMDLVETHQKVIPASPTHPHPHAPPPPSCGPRLRKQSAWGYGSGSRAATGDP